MKKTVCLEREDAEFGMALLSLGYACVAGSLCACQLATLHDKALAKVFPQNFLNCPKNKAELHWLCNYRGATWRPIVQMVTVPNYGCSQKFKISSFDN